MNRSGIPTLNAGAYDNLPGSSLRLSGDQRPTYTQRRRTQMAGGGIMGSNAGSMLVAPTADGSRPGYGWLEDAWETAKKVGQTLIPGGDPGYFDLYPDKSPPDQPDYGPYSTSPTHIPEGQPDYGPYSTSPTHIPEGKPDYGPYSTSPIFTPPTFPTTGWPGPGAGEPEATGDPYTLDMDPRNILEKGWDLAKEQVGDILNPPQGKYNPDTGKVEYPINWKGPLTMGTSIGLADYLSRDKTPFPADQTSINFQTAEEAMADSKQRFKPPRELTQLAAEGGRIGAANGGIQGLMPRRGRVMYPGGYGGKDDEYDTSWKAFTQNPGPDLTDLDIKDALRLGLTTKQVYQRWMDRRNWRKQNKAQGGRIGYADGTEEWMSEKEKGPLYIDPESVTTRDAPLTSFESDLRFIDKEDRIDMYYDMLKRLHGMSDEEKRDYLHERPWYRPEGKGTALEFTEDPVFEEFYETGEHFNQGGRIGADEGGLMNLGGMEKDYRQEGGFVPIGGQEKADDVPARLSKNEFVFTADAVRAAGGGDIDAGAEVMENIMENLEAGGQISEESQGQGAQGMYDNMKQLETRIA